jgi:hypothetical protein
LLNVLYVLVFEIYILYTGSSGSSGVNENEIYMLNNFFIFSLHTNYLTIHIMLLKLNLKVKIVDYFKRKK